MWWVRSDDPVPNEDQKMSFSARDRGLVHVIYVPAARDPNREIRSASAALIGRLLNIIAWPTDLREQLTQGSEGLDNLVTGTRAIGTIQQSILNQWQSLHD